MGRWSKFEGKVHQWECHKGNKNQWIIISPYSGPYAPEGWFNIITNKDYCLSSHAVDGKITQNPCDGESNQNWRVNVQGDSVVIINQEGRVMDGEDAKRQGKIFGRVRNANTAGQNWQIENMYRDFYRIRNVQGYQCVDDMKGQKNGDVHFWNCDNSNRNTRFRFKAVQGGPAIKPEDKKEPAPKPQEKKRR